MRYAMLTATHLSSHDDQKAVIDRYADDTLRFILYTMRPGRQFPTVEVIDAPAMMHLQRSTRHTYTHLILSNICAVFPHDSGPIIKQDKRTWKIASHDVTCTHHIGADTFKEATGRMPEPWELDRINCPHSGQLGHYACGWCSFHRQPILICGCRNREP